MTWWMPLGPVRVLHVDQRQRREGDLHRRRAPLPRVVRPGRPASAAAPASIAAHSACGARAASPRAAVARVERAADGARRASVRRSLLHVLVPAAVHAAGRRAGSAWRVSQRLAQRGAEAAAHAPRRPAPSQTAADRRPPGRVDRCRRRSASTQLAPPALQARDLVDDRCGERARRRALGEHAPSRRPHQRRAGRPSRPRWRRRARSPACASAVRASSASSQSTRCVPPSSQRSSPAGKSLRRLVVPVDEQPVGGVDVLRVLAGREEALPLVAAAAVAPAGRGLTPLRPHAAGGRS